MRKEKNAEKKRKKLFLLSLEARSSSPSPATAKNVSLFLKKSLISLSFLSHFKSMQRDKRRPRSGDRTLISPSHTRETERRRKRGPKKKKKKKDKNKFSPPLPSPSFPEKNCRASENHSASASPSVELLLLVGHDRAVGRRVRHARQHEALGDLVVVEEGLVGLVSAARDDLARARGAGPGAARVGEVDAGLLCGVQDVGVVCWKRGCVSGVTRGGCQGGGQRKKEEEQEQESKSKRPKRRRSR